MLGYEDSGLQGARLRGFGREGLAGARLRIFGTKILKMSPAKKVIKAFNKFIIYKSDHFLAGMGGTIPQAPGGR